MSRVAIAVLVLTTVVACSSDDEPRAAAPVRAPDPSSAGCRKDPVAPGDRERTMTSGGIERKFLVTVPKGYDGRQPLPVVLALHALTVSHRVTPSLLGFPDFASRYEFIGVSPSGRLDGTTPYWLAAPTTDNYDVGFFNDLLDLLEAELCIDRSRVYATGMSNGAQMSSLLGCRLSGRIAALAAVAGVEFAGSCGDSPVPVLAIHGTADPIVTYEGGGLNATKISDMQYWKGSVPPGLPVHRGVDAAMESWAAHNRCGSEPAEERVSPSVRRRSWSGCRAETVLYVVDGGGHAWPGKPVPQFEASFGPATTEIDASSLIFEFFFERGGPSRRVRPS